MKSKALKYMTYIAAWLFIFSGSALDSQSYIPSVICLLSLFWLCLMAYVHREELMNW